MPTSTPSKPVLPDGETLVAVEDSIAPAKDRQVWLIDGFNVVQVGLLRGRSRDGWWSEERRSELLERAACFIRKEAQLWVVFDGSRVAEPRVEGRVHCVFAASADTWLVARVKQLDDPSRVVVVTADRRLANRVRHQGARVISPGDFLRDCGPPEPVDLDALHPV